MVSEDQGSSRTREADMSALIDRVLRAWTKQRDVGEPNSAYGTTHDLSWSRSGVMYLKRYHEKFRHNDANPHCSCGQDKTPTHIVHCRQSRAHCDEWSWPRDEPKASSVREPTYLLTITGLKQWKPRSRNWLLRSTPTTDGLKEGDTAFSSF